MKNISKLKKNIFASILVLTGGMLSNLSMANAYDGKITFLGKISNATCEISGGNTNGTETTNPNFSVTLPTVSTTAFKSLGDRAGDTDFFIKLKGSNCLAGDGYAIKFERISSSDFIDPKTGYLKNMRSTGAKNIQLVISDENKNDFDFTTSKDTSPTKKRETLEDETMFNFGVQYISTAANVTPGEVEGNVYYSVVYP
ncbi:fimbrial protein [Klebsiella sp. BIGb0407]|uniref:fimbrial protein n=1 Tax=Klebsiella sp. BIGb0407 TaxID=2940603 RepID=UPI00216A0A4E|nr:fimbrial protein [Klebsiella sp. BIGb0407]MCS3433159.1 major type 1 subunit fimbrin (pilin) [Klebsiella sp. BIGb0407]